MTESTSISVIIPTFERPKELNDCLQALAESDPPAGTLEVIVVDDGSRHDLGPVVERSRPGFDLRLLRQQNAGPAAARNRGAREARGTLLAFLDDDCIPHSDWLSGLARAHLDHPGALLAGRVLNGFPDNPYSATSQLILDLVYEQTNQPDRTTFATSNNLAVPVDGFDAIGGFDTDFRTAEDRDFCDRWLASGRRIETVADAVVVHYKDLRLSSYCRQLFEYGKGASDFYVGRSNLSEQVSNSRRFHADPRKWLLAPLRRPDVRNPVSTALLLLLWQLSNAAGFLWRETTREG